MGYRYNYISRLSFQILPQLRSQHVLFVNLPKLPARNLMIFFSPYDRMIYLTKSSTSFYNYVYPTG